MIFSRRPKIEFFSVIPEVAKVAPIIPASKVRPAWMERAAREYSQIKSSEGFGKQSLVHTAKCPGIYNLVRYGWVMVAWQDILISTNGDGHSFEWKTPLNQRNMDGGSIAGDYVGFHPAHQYANYLGGFEDAMPFVLKIQSPWRCVVPNGYYLHEGPMPHTDERRFTTLPGLFSREYGTAQMNPQLKWHVFKGDEVIKAGTPLAHYMLVPKEQADFKVEAANPDQMASEKTTLIEIGRRFVKNNRESKCFFENFFKSTR